MNDRVPENVAAGDGQIPNRMIDILMFAINHAQENVFLITKNGRFSFVNETACQSLGYTRAELLDMGLPDIAPNFPSDTWFDYWKNRTAESYRVFETCYRAKDGRLIPVEHSSYFFGYDDKSYIMALGRDITERKRAEESLRVSEEKFLKAFNANPAITSISTMEDGRFIDVNERFLQLHGFSIDEVIGRTSVELGIFLPEARASMRHAFEKNGCLRDYVVSLGTKAGDVRDCLASGEMIDIAGRKHLLIQMNDITERKRAEKTVRESQRQLLEAQSLAHIGRWEYDLLTHRITLSDEIFRIMEKDSMSFILSREALLDVTHPDDREAVVSAFVKAKETHQPWRATHRLLFPDGRMKYLHQQGEFFYSPEGQPIRAVGITQDITELKQAEEEKKNLELQLAQSQKIESVGRLAGGVAHDFNNMLSVIIGSAQLAIMKTDSADPLYKQLNDILNAGMRSAGLTRQLLAFARKQTINPRVLDLNDTVASMFKMFQRLLGENIELVWRPGKKLWRVKMDPSQVDQLLANLAVNARDAIDNLGRIIIETSNVVCDETYCSTRSECVTGEYVLLSVSDDGCGMTKETLNNIFEPFFTTKKEGRGTGLGLSTVYGIVKQNGGFINVYSELGSGTTFKIYLPRSQDKDSETTGDSTLNIIEGGEETVLIVEDEPAVLELSRDMLETLGYKVLTAKGVEQALQLVETHDGTIELLLIDVVMPDMNGKELSERIMSIKPGLKRLFMSGYTADVIARQGILEEGVQLINKPFSLSGLAAKVREVLGS